MQYQLSILFTFALLLSLSFATAETYSQLPIINLSQGAPLQIYSVPLTGNAIAIPSNSSDGIALTIAPSPVPDPSKTTFYAADSFWALLGSGLYPVDSTVNVGIGTSVPNAKLHVVTLPNFPSLIVGSSAVATGDNSFALGLSSRALGDHSIAFGDQALANSSFALALGSFSSAYAGPSVSLGYSTSSFKPGSVALGVMADAKESSLAIGFGYDGTRTAVSSGINSIAIGKSAYSSGIQSTVLGNLVNSTGSRSFVAGYNSQVLSDGSIAIGSKSVVGKAIAVGNSLSIGSDNYVQGDYSTGLGSSIIVNNSQSQAVGYNSYVLGYDSFALGNYIRVLGNGTGVIRVATSSAVTTVSQNDALILFAQKVGINTATPRTTLEVNGTINSTGDICIIGGPCLSSVVSGSGARATVSVPVVVGTSGSTKVSYVSQTSFSNSSKGFSCQQFCTAQSRLTSCTGADDVTTLLSVTNTCTDVNVNDKYCACVTKYILK